MTPEQKIAHLEAEVARLQRIIDSRPAINAGLPETCIKWSQSIYLLEAQHIRPDIMGTCQ